MGMFDLFLEQWASMSNRRFKLFLEGKNAYESFIGEYQVRYDEISDEIFRLARADLRLGTAEASFLKAAALCRTEKALRDEAVAQFQLGLICRLRNELDAAELLLKYVLKVLGSLPGGGNADMSDCLFHLGLISLKKECAEEAARYLRFARRIDLGNADFQGVYLCDAALERCREAGVDIDGMPEVGSTDDSEWFIADGLWGQIDGEAEEEEPLDTAEKAANERLLILVVSYSVEANDVMMGHLESLGEDFGRPVSVSQVACGSPYPEQRRFRRPDRDQHLCATILVVEQAGLSDPRFQELALMSIQRVVTVADFRLLVYLNDLTTKQFQQLSDEPLVGKLFDSTQVSKLPSLRQLKRTLVPFIKKAGHISSAEHWKALRLKLAVGTGKLIRLLLVILAIFSLLGFPVWFFGWRQWAVYPPVPEIASLVLGLLVFPLQAPLIYFVLRGLKVTAAASRDNPGLTKWVFVSMFFMLAANHLQHDLGGPHFWIYPGMVMGVLLDAIRRAGRKAARQSIRVEDKIAAAKDPAMADPKATIFRGDPVNPFDCRIIPSLSSKVFISYTTCSEKGNQLATWLYSKLKAAGAQPYLDRASISAGENWRRSLNGHLGECDTFLCILEQKSVKSEWVGAELLAAIEAHRLTNSPNIVILVDPAILAPGQDMLPVFRGIATAVVAPPVPGRPQIILINDQTLETVVWGLAPGRFQAPAVLPLFVSNMVRVVSVLPWSIGIAGTIMGFALGFVAILEKNGNFQAGSFLNEKWLQEVLTLLAAFWTGFVARVSIFMSIENNARQEIGITFPALAAAASWFGLVVFAQQSSAIVIAWAIVLAVTGWMTVLAFDFPDRKEKTGVRVGQTGFQS